MRNAQDFFIEAALEIPKRFPIGDPVIEMLQVLDPDVTLSKFPSLVPLASKFPNLIPTSKLQLLDSEWRKLSFTTLPFDRQRMEPEVFWGKIRETIYQTVKELCNFTLFYILGVTL